MPQNPVLVISTESGEPCYMHSIDASDGLKLGDYRLPTEEEAKSSDPKYAAALNRMRNVNVNAPPEFQSPEERAAIRKAANEEAARVAAVQEQYAAGESFGVRQALGAPQAGSPPAHPAPAPAAAPAESARSGRRGE